MAKKTVKTLAPTPDQAVADRGMRPTAQPPLRGKLVPKKGSGKSDAPDNAGTATHRSSALWNENMGARFGVQGINMNALPASNKESQATQANGLIVRSMPSRLGNFGDGISYSQRG